MLTVVDSSIIESKENCIQSHQKIDLLHWPALSIDPRLFTRSLEQQSCYKSSVSNTKWWANLNPDDWVNTNMSWSIWDTLPPRAWCFILNTPLSFKNPREVALTLSKLIKCWSFPQNIWSTFDQTAFNTVVCLVSVYLKEEIVQEAQSLVINTACLDQCRHTGIKHGKELMESGDATIQAKFPYFFHGLIKSIQKHALVSFVQTTLSRAQDYLDDTSNGWESTSSASMDVRHNSKISSTNSGT